MANGFKTGGRQKGTPNKTTLANREKLQKIFDEEISSPRFSHALTFLPDRDYVYVILKIGALLVPKPNDSNTAEIPKEEVNAQRPLFRVNPVGEREEVECSRAADPEEAELAKLLYPEEKSKEEQAREEQQQAANRISCIRYPLATREESDQLDKRGSISVTLYARLILWNEKNAERWKREDEEMMRNNPNHSYSGKESPPAQGS